MPNRTPDGMMIHLPPSVPGLAIGAGIVVIGLVAAIEIRWWIALPVCTAGLLGVWMASGGQRRLRVTVSKLLIEDERPVLGLLIGPLRSRVAFADIKAVKVEEAGGKAFLRVESATGPVDVAHGEAREDLEWLAGRITDAAARPQLI